MILKILKQNKPEDIFEAAIIFMLEACGDGDCVIMSDNYEELANKFEIWLKEEDKRRFPAMGPDYLKKEVFKDHDVINFFNNQEYISFGKHEPVSKFNYHTIIIMDGPNYIDGFEIGKGT